MGQLVCTSKMRGRREEEDGGRNEGTDGGEKEGCVYRVNPKGCKRKDVNVESTL